MVEYALFAAEQAGPLADELGELYAEVYAEPPYNEGAEHLARFREHYAQELGRQGFSLAGATSDGKVIGVAYGWTMGPDGWFRSATTEPPEPLRGVSKFAIMEWMVGKSHRGTGIGRTVLDLLLTGRPEPWAILASNPEATARRIYDRLGWRKVSVTRPTLMPQMDVLALPLHPTSPM